MAGLLEQLKTKFGGNESKLIGPVMGLLQERSSVGGIGGVLNRFKSTGASQQADSWVSTGSNKPVSGEQVQQALGKGEVQRIATETGMSEQEASKGIANVLPEAIDKMTPDGQVPSGDQLQQRIGMAQDKLG